MQDSIIIKGRLTGPRNVVLDEPVTAGTGDVEVIVRLTENTTIESEANVFDFLRRLPEGTRTREDIDSQIRDEREAWGKDK